MNDNGLSIEYTPSGRNGSATLVAKLNDEPIAVESVNLAKQKARKDFVEQLCKDRPGIAATDIDVELLKIAAELASDKKDDTSTDVEKSTEIDMSQIVRPERFITSDVSGLAVPTMIEADGKPVGRWRLYLRWPDGRRESQAMPQTIDLPTRSPLWIDPQPSDPTPNMFLGWSVNSRHRWLDGHDAPNAAELFRRVCERIAYFLDLPPQHAPGMTSTLALWAIFTYGYVAWDAVPYLYVGGPLSSGKSRVFEILARLVFRPLTSSSLTGPALFRTLHDQGGTLLYDEAERLKQSTPDIGEVRSMLLTGYKRGGKATRLEPVGDTFKKISFDVYGPKALACIAGLPPALASRCIPMMMFRAAPESDKPRRRIDEDPADWQRLRDDLHILALERGSTWRELANQTDVCPTMSGRDFELWQPLLALASWIEEEGANGLSKLMQNHALATINEYQDDQTPDHDEILLRTLADEIQHGNAPTPGEILAKVKEREPDSLKGWSAKAVSNHLKRYGLVTKKSHGRKVYGRVTVDQMQQIQTTYSVDLGMETQGQV